MVSTLNLRMWGGGGFTMRNFIICTVHIERVAESRGLIWAGYFARMEEIRKAIKILTGTLTG